MGLYNRSSFRNNGLMFIGFNRLYICEPGGMRADIQLVFAPEVL